MDRELFKTIYLNFVTSFGLQPENVVVSAGGALLMLGLRPRTEDLDLDVPELIYNSFKHVLGGQAERTSSHGTYLDVTTRISIHIAPEGIVPIQVDEVWIYPIAELIKQKTKLSIAIDRLPEKATQDKADILALETML